MSHGYADWAVSLTMAAACALAQADTPNLLSDFVGATSEPAAPWHVVGLPKQTKPLTRFRIVAVDDVRVLEIDADASYGNLVHDLGGAGDARRLSWRWRVERGNPAGDPRARAGDDHVVAVCVLFDLPMTAVPFVERQALRAARALSGQDLPSATMCYTWDERQSAGTVLSSPFTRRVRYLVLRGSGEALHEWRQEQRDLQADFLRLFGAESGVMPPLLAVAVSGDADNTGGHSVALLNDLVLR